MKKKQVAKKASVLKRRKSRHKLETATSKDMTAVCETEDQLCFNETDSSSSRQGKYATFYTSITQPIASSEFVCKLNLWVIVELMTTPTFAGGRNRPQLARVNELKNSGRSQSLDGGQTNSKPLVFGELSVATMSLVPIRSRIYLFKCCHVINAVNKHLFTPVYFVGKTSLKRESSSSKHFFFSSLGGTATADSFNDHDCEIAEDENETTQGVTR